MSEKICHTSGDQVCLRPCGYMCNKCGRHVSMWDVVVYWLPEGAPGPNGDRALYLCSDCADVIP